MSMLEHPEVVFYLTTDGECSPILEPRACWFIRRMKSHKRDDCMLVRIHPPLDGKYFGLGIRCVYELILSTRLPDHSLYPISQWPTPVYVERVVDKNVLKGESYTNDQVEFIACGDLYNNLQTATEAARHGAD